MTLKSINPFSQVIIHETEEMKDHQIESCLQNTEKAFKTWKSTSFENRKQLMLRVSQLLKEKINVLSETITNEMGKLIAESEAEVLKCSWVCEHYARDTELLLTDEAVFTEAYNSYVTHDPLGCILGIMPWNFPFWQVFRFVAPTLMSGNVILLKHASNVQLCAQSIEDLFTEAGFPKGVFQNLAISSVKVKPVIENKIVKAVSLTGSEGAGKKVASVASNCIKKSVLELGGSNAFIVLDDADLNKAADIAIKARMQNAGQSCIAAKRFLIHKKISEEFLILYKEKMDKLVPGDPMNRKTTLAPLANEQQVKILKNQVEKSVAKGAVISNYKKPKQCFFYPTLATMVKPGMPLFDEEVFGPVTPITIIKDSDEAIKLANMSDYGLGVSVFSNDLDKMNAMIPQFEDGAVFVNNLVKSDPRLPFGGTKKSGYGRELAKHGLFEFVNVKTVYIDNFLEKNIKNEKKAVKSTGM